MLISCLGQGPSPVWLITASEHTGPHQTPELLYQTLEWLHRTPVRPPADKVCGRWTRQLLHHRSVYWPHRHVTARNRPVSCADCWALRVAGLPQLPVILYVVSIMFDLTFQSCIPLLATVGWSQTPYNTLVAGHDVCAVPSPAFMWFK